MKKHISPPRGCLSLISLVLVYFIFFTGAAAFGEEKTPADPLQSYSDAAAERAEVTTAPSEDSSDDFASLRNDIKKKMTPAPSPTDDDIAELAKVFKDTTPENAIKMTLEECVALALRRNVNIETAYIDRVLQKFNLVTNTTYYFIPNVTISGELKHAYNDTLNTSHTDTTDSISGYSFNRSKDYSTSLNGGPTINGNVPGGATYTLSWGGTTNSQDAYSRTFGGGSSQSQDIGWDPTKSSTLQSDLTLSFSQPLLKGFGYDYSMATSRQANISDKINLLNLKSTIISELTQTISAYRSLLEAKWSLAIAKESLERSENNLKVAKVKVKLGKLASMDLVQYESNVASQEISLESARSTYFSAQLELLRLLDLKPDTVIEPVEKLAINSLPLEYDKCEELLLENSPSYLSAKLDLLNSEIDLMIARRDRLWELDLTGSTSLTGSSTDTDTPLTNTTTLADGRQLQWSLGLSLSFPLFGSSERNLRQAVLSAQAALYKARIQFRKDKEDLLSELKEKLTTISISGKQLETARRSTKLAQQKLQVEQTKLNYGLSSSFNVLSYEDDLVSAQETELSTRITYLNYLSSLDQFLGTTLNTWGISFKDFRKGYEERIKEVTQ